ncbi:MAG: hypothetical protein ACFCD0_06800 [Gemmataceae bacterium]
MDVKDFPVESAEVVARCTEAHAEMFGVERLSYVHPDCSLQALPRHVAEGKLQLLVQCRDLFFGRSGC